MDQMPPLAGFIFSPGYARLTANFAVACLLGALIFTILALIHYGRAREGSTGDPIVPPWMLLVATWRDSMIVTLLFVAEALLFRATQFAAASDRDLSSLLHTIALAEPMIGVILMTVIFTILFLRIRALSLWIRAQG